MHGPVRSLGLALVALLEHHFDRRPKQKKTAGNPESGQADPHQVQEAVTGEREEGENQNAQRCRLDGDGMLFARRHACRERKENRRHTDWIDDDEHRQKG